MLKVKVDPVFSKIMAEKLKVVPLALLMTALAFLILAACTPLANWLAQPLYVEPTPKKADVIVVLSGGTYPNGSLSYFTLERIIYGIKLYQGGWAKRIIFSGGRSRRNPLSDAENMKRFALDFGIPEEDIITEPESQNTYENIFNTAEIMRNGNLKRALLVTTPIHLFRSYLIGQKSGVDFIPASPPSFDRYRLISIDRLLLTYFTLREYLAICFYKLRGLI